MATTIISILLGIANATINKHSAHATMKNSASNSSITQALRAQAAHILPAVTVALATLGYDEICHQRIGQQPVNQLHYHKATRYHGLTRAQHPQFGCVMIKWGLGSDNTNFANYESLSNLAHEIMVLKTLNTEHQNPTTIAPPLLAYNNLSIQILDQSPHLTALVMPYYPNGSLATQLSSQKHSLLTAKQKQHLIMRAARLTANLHNTGWLHNDIKPSNILLDGFLKNNADNSSITPDLLLTDFALAERVDNSFDINVDKNSRTAASGTPAYFAPERWQGQSATQKSDIYAFGIMMYEILTGGRPFKINHQSSDPMIDWATQHCQQPIPVLPKEYQHYQMVIDTALAKRVERRYQSMEAVLENVGTLGNS